MFGLVVRTSVLQLPYDCIVVDYFIRCFLRNVVAGNTFKTDIDRVELFF